MTKLIGILNITPDSFSDGGKYFDTHAALAAIAELIEAGADVIDIGAESTRPGATPLSPEEEWRRLAPVLSELKFFKGSVLFSLDTRYAATAARGLPLGVDWVNDVSGFQDEAMIAAVKNNACKLVVMHSLSIPANKNIVLPEDADVMAVLKQFADIRIEELQKKGIDKWRIYFDPGIGFGKTTAQSLKILADNKRLEVGVPLVVGHSRKSCLADLAPTRDEATLIVSRDLALKGVGYLRVHDVAGHRAMLNQLEIPHG